MADERARGTARVDELYYETSFSHQGGDAVANGNGNGNGKASGSKTLAKKGSKKRKTSASGSETEESDPEPTGAKVKRKRNRLALSCASCRSRKIRCDRRSPCFACCARGEESLCSWESAQKEATPQPFALASQHAQFALEQDALRLRVERLEALCANLAEARPSHYVRHEPDPQEEDAYSRLDLQENERLDSDTEDAAIVLEELALGRKLFRVGRARNPSLVQASDVPPPPVPTPPHFASPTPFHHEQPVSRAMSSILLAADDVAHLAKRRILDEIWGLLPSRAVLSWAVTHYFNNVQWSWHLLHRQTFEAEVDAFISLLDRPERRLMIDPLFLAVLFQMLCLSINSLDTAIESPLVRISIDDLNKLPQLFFGASQSALECGDWTGKPRIRTLQTICLFAPYLLFSGENTMGERHQIYLAAGIRQCQQMGLHQLGHSPHTMPPLDPALPAQPCTLRREIPIRLLHVLLFLDYMAIRVKSGLPPHLVNVALPLNLNDEELSDDPNSFVEPRSASVASDFSLDVVKFRIALLQRRINEAITSNDHFEYELVLSVDQGYRDIINSLPQELQHDYAQDTSMAHTWRRNSVTQTIHNRLLRLHRPFMSRGYREERYRFSLDSAIDASRLVLHAQIALNRAPLLKAGFQLLNVQSAVVILFMDLWTRFEPHQLVTNPDYQLIQMTVPFFTSNLVSRLLPVRNIASQSLQVISLLFDALTNRARVPEGGEVETYGRLLKRIGEVVISTAAAAVSRVNATNPTTALSPSLVPWTGGRPFDNDVLNQMRLEDPVAVRSPVNPNAPVDFNIGSLAGPEYADGKFSWDNFDPVDQFISFESAD